jgi:hypothetical protein
MDIQKVKGMNFSKWWFCEGNKKMDLFVDI